MSRRTKRGIILGLVLIAFFLVLLDHSINDLRKQKPQQPSGVSSEDMRKYNRKFFKVLGVVDGDTFDIDVPDGRQKYTRIRLWGIDTPETKNYKTGVMYYGPQASEFAKQVLLGEKVNILLSEKRTRGKYGRLLAYVRTGDGENFNEMMIEQGLAYADLRFNHLYYYKYQRLEAIARKKGKGLWKGVKFEQLPDWLRDKRPELLKDR